MMETAVCDIRKAETSSPEIEISDIVMSVNGRDKGKMFFVIQKEDIYAMLCDGKARRFEKPKRKKIKHIRLACQSDCRTALKIRNGMKVTNSEIRKALAEYPMDNRGEKEVCK